MKRFTAEAEDELAEAAIWYQNRRAGLGTEFLEEAERVFEAIEENPRQYPVCHSTSAEPTSAVFPTASITSSIKM